MILSRARARFTAKMEDYMHSLYTPSDAELEEIRGAARRYVDSLAESPGPDDDAEETLVLSRRELRTLWRCLELAWPEITASERGVAGRYDWMGLSAKLRAAKDACDG